MPRVTHLRTLAKTLGALALGGLAIAGAIFVFRQGLLPLIDKAFHPPAQWLGVIRRSGILLVAVAAYWAFVRLHDKRHATELHFQPVRALVGAASGSGLVLLPIALLFAIGAYEAVVFRGFALGLFGAASVIVVASVLEELMYRCLLFRVLERGLGTALALVVQALVFALMHLGNVAQHGASQIATMLVSVTLIGLLWASIFVLTRNLWVVGLHHAAWNFTILLSGVPLSGIEEWRTLALMESRYAGPDWLTGGHFGPENSLVLMAFAVVALVLLARAARRSGHWVAPPA